MDLPIVLVKNLPYDASSSLLLDLFSKYGPVNQLRISDGSAPAGTCYVVYTEIDDAKKAARELSGINFMNRYLVLGLFKADKDVLNEAILEQRRETLEAPEQDGDVVNEENVEEKSTEEKNEEETNGK